MRKVWYFRLSIVLTFLLGVMAQSQTTVVNKNFSNFTSGNLGEFQLNNRAAFLNPNASQVLRMTDYYSQSSSAFLRDAISLDNNASFSAYFRFRFVSPFSGGADGLVFTVQTVSNTAGSSGGGIGYQGLSRSIGVEFDNWDNGFGDGYNDSHVGIDINGDINSVVRGIVSPNLDSGNIWNAWVDYDGDTQRLEVRLSLSTSRPASPYLSHVVNLPGVLQSTNAFVGFTSATGGAASTHEVLSFSFTNTYQPIIVNQPPVAQNDSITLNEDTSANIAVLTNDSDADNNPLSITSVSQPANGSAINNGNSITYVSASNFYGSNSFNYTISDGNGGTGTATVFVTVNPVNDAPSFTKGANQTVNEDSGSQSVAGWASGINAGPGNESGQSLNFIVANNNNSLFSVQPTVAANGTLTYTPAPNANGTATVTVSLIDNGGTANGGVDTSGAQTFTISVNPINDAPVAANEAYSTNEDTTLNISASGVLGNDSDVDGNSLTAVLVSGPAYGTLTLNANGSFTYSPNTNYHGGDSFTYQASDGSASSNVATVNLTVNSVNDSPVALDDTATTDEETAVSINVLGNDSDVDGDGFTINIDSSNTSGSVTLQTQTLQVISDGGTQAYGPLFSGAFSPWDNIPVQPPFTPQDNAWVSTPVYVGNHPWAVNFSADWLFVGSSMNSISGPGRTDGQNWTKYEENFNVPGVALSASLSWGSDNYAYVFINGHFINPDVNISPLTSIVYNIDVLPYLHAGNNTLSFILYDGGGLGGMKFLGDIQYQQIVYDPNDQFEYLAVGEAATDTFSYTISDGNGGSDTAQVLVTINGLNDAPVLSPLAGINGNEGDVINVSAPFADVDTSDTHTAVINWGDGNSTPAVVSSNTVTGSYVYADNGSYTVTVTVTDSANASASQSTNATILNVAPVVAAGDDRTVNEGDTVSYNGAFTDAGSADTHTLNWDFGDGGTLGGTLTPTHVYADNGVYTVTLTVADDDGGVTADTLVVTVNNVNPEVAAGNDQTVDEGGVISLDPATFTDAGTGDTHTAVIDWGDSIVEAGSVTQGAGSGSVSGSHVYADNGIYTVIVTVTDDDGAVAADALMVTVDNLAPAVASGPDRIVNEGDVLNLAPSTFADQGTSDTHTATVDWGDGTAVENGAVAQSPYGPPGSITGQTGSVSGSHIYTDNGSYTVTLTVTDDDGASTVDTLEVIVNNVNPVVTSGNNQTGNEGDVVSLDPATFTDASIVDTHTASINWGDGIVEAGTLSQGAGSGAVDGSHVYADNGVYTVTVTVTDDDGGVGSDSITVTVNNVSPIVEAGSDKTINESDTISLDPSTFSDQGTLDTHTAVIDWGDGSATNSGLITESPFGPPGSTAGQNGSVGYVHAYLDNGTYTVTVIVTDDDEGVGSDTFTVTVNNVAPTCGPITGLPSTPVLLGSSITGSVAFTDPGILDTHTAVWNWGNGVTTTGTVTENSGSGSVGGSYTYPVPGIYPISLTLTDKDSGTCTSIASYYVIVYDPNGNFVTGGGWLMVNSVKSEFGFSAKYVKNKALPVGEIEFKSGGLKFKSASLDWLVVNENQAKFMGSGKVNESGDYGFIATAIDNGKNGDGTLDQFHIKIWDKVTGQVIFDNVPSEPDHSYVAQQLGNGSIVIHKLEEKDNKDDSNDAEDEVEDSSNKPGKGKK